MKNNKIVLGTANFKKNYGIKKKKLKKSVKKKIIKFSLKNNIIYFDTALNYQNASGLLASILPKNKKVITKIAIPKNVKNYFDYIIFKIGKSLKEFETNKFYAVLLHNSENLKNSNNRKIIDALNYLKKIGKIEKFGLSIYSLKELDKFYNFLKPEVIQIPLNLFDQRLLKSKWLKILKKNKVEIHARSIFLQGALLESKLPFKVSENIYKHWIKWKNWQIKNKIKSFEACMQFINQQKEVDKIVFGVDNLSQLKQILNFEVKKKLNFSSLSLDSEEILHPQNWSKL